MLSINLASKISNKDKTAVNAKQIFFDPDYIEKNLNAVLLGSARYLIDHSDEIDKIQIIKNFEEYKKFRCYIINQSDTNNTKRSCTMNSDSFFLYILNIFFCHYINLLFYY